MNKYREQYKAKIKGIEKPEFDNRYWLFLEDRLEKAEAERDECIKRLEDDCADGCHLIDELKATSIIEGLKLCDERDRYKKSLEWLVLWCLTQDDPCISIGRGKELLGFKDMNEMRDFMNTNKEKI